ncbi:MAG TPA: M48 family metalloprotease, partial [Chthonomonadaceae bacterium]|nr:M48 family metalloprotease [Chthonomonadaceae bacterium]
MRWRMLPGLAALILILGILLPGLAQPPPAAHTLTIASAVGSAYIPHVPARAIVYQHWAYALGLAGLAWSLLGLWLLLQTGLSARVRSALFHRLRLPDSAPCPPSFRAVAAYLLFYALFMLGWTLPFRVAGLALEAHFGFSRESAGVFVGDLARDLLFGLVVIPLYWGGYWLYARFPRRWWLILWAILVPLLFFQFELYPVLVAPAYNRFTPLPPGPLRTRILALANRAGITGAHVFVEDTSRRTTHVNAYVAGIGPTTRIVLNDTAIKSLPEKELLAMLAHEMGHYVEGHSWINFAAGVVGAGVFLWL